MSFDPYTTTKFIHILLAIVAVGFNASYGIWLARAAREPEHLAHVLRGIKTLDDRFANPAYGLLLVTGFVTAFFGRIPFTTFWIAAAIVLWFITMILGVGLYAPTLRRQLRVLEAEGAGSAAFGELSRRSTVTGLVTIIPVALILLLMVFKPAQLG